MTDYENKNTQHQPSTGETSQSHENGLITTLRGLGAKSLERTKHTLASAPLIHWYGFPLPPYVKERQRQPATSHDSIDPLHHEAVLTHEGGTQDSAHSLKTGFYYGGKFIQAQSFQHMLRKPETNQQNTIASPED